MLPQGGLGGARPASPNTVTSAQHQHPLMSTSSKDTGMVTSTFLFYSVGVSVDEMDQQQSLSDDAVTNSAQNVSVSKNAANEEDPKVAYASDMSIWLLDKAYTNIMRC
nr:CCR4-Not complex, subunit 3/ 5 [Tanacetum cinerariifolium]